jgi:two-component system, cell cycle sensor histidine kinase and response regulator CckA
MDQHRVGSGPALGKTESKEGGNPSDESDAGEGGALAKLLAKLNEAQRVAEVGSWDWDMLNGEVWWSDETYRLFGADVKTYVPSFERNAEFIHPDDLETYRAVFAHSLSTDEPLNLEVRIRAGDGEIKVCLARGVVVRNAEGKAVRFVGTAQDITARKKTESERDRLIAAVEQAAEAICIAAPDTTVRYVNSAFEGLTGLSRQAAVGKKLGDLHSILSDIEPLRDLRASPPREVRWQGRLLGQRPDGQPCTVEVTLSPSSDKNAQVIDLVIVARDISLQLELENQLLSAQKLEAIGRLAGCVAHDFNNLLSVILNYAEFALEKLSPQDSMWREIHEIQKAGQRAAALTGQLLAFSRKQVLMPRVLDVNKVIADMEEMMRRLIGESIDLELRCRDDLGQVKADPSQLQQAVMNLAVNARDAMPGGGKLTIETVNVDLGEDYADKHVEMSKGRYVMLAVSDTGSGFDAATRARLFEPFFTTKERGRGTGLGLSTVYGIVKQSGGNILVYSEPGQGATFKIYLPRCDAPIDEVVASAVSVSVSTGTETILLVEDEEAVRMVAERILQGAGYRVLTAGDGLAALALAEQMHEEIDLLLTDVVLPQLSGRQLAERLHKLQPQLRVLYMSGYTDDAIVHHGVLDPGTLFIGKPFSAGALAIKVRDALDRLPV